MVGQAAQVVAIAAAGIENCVIGGEREDFVDACQQRRGHASIMEAATGCYCFGSIAWLFGAAFLGLEKIDIAAASYIEGMAGGAETAAVFLCEGPAAVPYGAEEHSSSVADESGPRLPAQA